MTGDKELAPSVVTPAGEKSGKYSPRQGSGGGGGGGFGQCNGQKVTMINLGLGVFLICNVIALYALHFGDRGHSGSSDKLLSQDLSLSSAQEGKAVSLGASGTISTGAGTTAYLNAAAVPQATLTTWMDLLPMGTSKASYSTNILTYTYKDGTNKVSYVGTVTVNDDRTLSISSTSKYSGTGGVLKRGATLSDTLAVFVTYDSTTFTNGLVLGTISDGKVTIDDNTYVPSVTASAAWTSVTRLTDTSFAITYYGKWVSGGSWSNYVNIGTVSNNKITMGTAATFGEDSSGTSETTINSPQSISSDGSRIVVPWYVSKYKISSNTAGVAKGFCLSVFDVSGGTATKHGDPVCADKYHPENMVALTSLTDDSIAVAFHDAANNNKLTILTVQNGAFDKIPYYRTEYVVPGVGGSFDFGNAYAFYPNVVLRRLPSSRLAVVFQNPSNRGKPSILTLAVGNELSLSLVTSPMPVTKPEFAIANTGSSQTGGSLYTDAVLTPNGFLVAYAGTIAGSVLNGLSLVETLGRPLGIVSSAGSSDAKVAFTGVASVEESLTVGQVVYASTSGKVYGSSSVDGGFTYADSNNVVLSRESLIGVAVDTDKVYVTGYQQ